MFIVLFLMLFLTVYVAWRFKRILAIYFFGATIVTMLVTELYFFYHSTSQLTLQL